MLMVEMSRIRLIISTAIFLVLADNVSFFKNVVAVYPLSSENYGFLASLFVFYVCFFVVIFCFFVPRFTLKPVLIFFTLTASLIHYFSSSYKIIIDETMVQNIVETNASESFDLITFKLILYFTMFGIIPSFVIFKIKLKKQKFKKVVKSTFACLFISLTFMAASVLFFNRFYTSFYREHKPLRYHTNPAYPIYSVGNYVSHRFFTENAVFKKLGLDAHQDMGKQGRRLAILVVGEAARADRFSLNGYQRETNPLLKKEDIINFSNMYSCGTTTAVSVPCMFSYQERGNYDDKEARSSDNVLDILARAGVNVLWRDNNSSSKGVADRLQFEDFRSPELNPICDSECRDLGMLTGLQEYIRQHDSGDILIVLHQMGNHGPAYYKRYPGEFEKFSSVCETSQLEECSADEIGNAYDNAILYTDFFLSQTIQLLNDNDGEFESALIYMSDHGESLGEGGLYLHGMPYFIAPETQKHVGSLMWFSESLRSVIDALAIKEAANQNFSHDNLFHTLLGLMQVKTTLYEKEKDILAR